MTHQQCIVKGCLILLQIWCYEHIVIGRPKLLDCPSTFPRVCRWESSGRQNLTFNFDELNHTQILWRLEPTSEEIQIDIIKEIPQEWYLRSGLGTIEEPIYIESERGIKMARVHQKEKEKEKEKEQEQEQPMMKKESTIFVLTDDDESNTIMDLKEENRELKAIVEKQSKEKEVMKKEIEELRMLVEKLRSNKTMMENCVSDLEKILSEYDLDS
ncbi:hypothetical protein L2E82_11479 [Cichorium intybus]|uniref:Uncharacterized protein n=1 Tax=Cichorium intybus TaxID=13427 RepID=A0ACB9GCX9_CICIN|nr:hypothetical protein L2E82_11479 [Cichorium intybus]